MKRYGYRLNQIYPGTRYFSVIPKVISRAKCCDIKKYGKYKKIVPITTPNGSP